MRALAMRCLLWQGGASRERDAAEEIGALTSAGHQEAGARASRPAGHAARHGHRAITSPITTRSRLRHCGVLDIEN